MQTHKFKPSLLVISILLALPVYQPASASLSYQSGVPTDKGSIALEKMQDDTIVLGNQNTAKSQKSSEDDDTTTDSVVANVKNETGSRMAGLRVATLAISQAATDQNPGQDAFQYGSSQAIGDYSIAIGDGSTAHERGSIALGSGNQAKALSSFATGNYSTAVGVSSFAQGFHSTAKGRGAIAMGTGESAFNMTKGTEARGDFSVAIGGVNGIAGGQSSVALGGAQALGQGSFAVGQYVKMQSSNPAWTETVQPSKAIGDFSVAMGRETESKSNYAVALGYKAIANGQSSIAMGQGAQTLEERSLAMGGDAIAMLKYSVALGQGSLANRAAGVIGLDITTGSQSKKTDIAWKATHSAVAIGQPSYYTRQIIGVAAGRSPTDAVNVAQLQGVWDATKGQISDIDWKVDTNNTLNKGDHTNIRNSIDRLKKNTESSIATVRKTAGDNLTKITEMETTVNDHTAKIGNIEKNLGELNKLGDQVSKNTKAIADMKTQIDGSIANLDTKIDDKVTDKLKDVNGKIDKNTAKIAEVDGKAEANKTEIANVKQDVGKVKTQVEQNTAKISQMESTVGQYSDKISEVETKVGKNTEKINSVETTVNQTADAMKGVQTQVNTLGDQVKTASETVNTVKETVSQHTEQLGEMNKRIETNTNSISTIQTQMEGVNTQVTQNTERIEQIDHRVSDLDSRIDRTGANAAALAALHPLDYDPNVKFNLAGGYGHYRGKNAVALGAFYRPSSRVMFSVGGSTAGTEHMVNAGVTVALGAPSELAGLSKAQLMETINRQELKLRKLEDRVDELVSLLEKTTQR